MPAPSDAIAHLRHVLADEYEAFAQALCTVPPVSLRLNAAKSASKPIFADTTPVPWCATGFYLPQRPSFTLDPLLHAGAYYVQEASSMFVEQALRQHADLSQALSVLDLCAAPGGKSTLLVSLLNADSCLLANETVRSRAHILSENLAKWGSPHTAVTCNDPAQFAALAGCFDVLLCDAPCSGEGMFRKTPEAAGEWSMANVQLCAKRQSRILADAANLLDEGGLMVYSTCTFNPIENEEQVACLLQHTHFDYVSLRLDLAHFPQVVETCQTLPNGKIAYGYRFYPHRIEGEGLFIACLRRQDHPTTPQRTTKPHSPDKNRAVNAKERQALSAWLDQPKDFEYIQHLGEYYALPHALWTRWRKWANNPLLYWLNMGVKLGKLNGNNLIPAPELALSTALSPHINTIALSHEQALSYLRKEEINGHLPTTSNTWAAVAYEGLCLGWVKILQGRLNNHYPKEWRIRMNS